MELHKERQSSARKFATEKPPALATEPEIVIATVTFVGFEFRSADWRIVGAFEDRCSLIDLVEHTYSPAAWCGMS